MNGLRTCLSALGCIIVLIGCSHIRNVSRESAHLSAKNAIKIKGGVAKPGIYQIDHQGRITIADALRLAGGPVEGDMIRTPIANTKKIYLFRQAAGGYPDWFILDARRDKGKDRYFIVHPGDLIEVPIFF
jgi:hypothetical protein